MIEPDNEKAAAALQAQLDQEVAAVSDLLGRYQDNQKIHDRVGRVMRSMKRYGTPAERAVARLAACEYARLVIRLDLEGTGDEE